MNRKALIEKLEAEFEETRKNIKENKCIPVENFDWNFLFSHIAESRAEYRVTSEAWTTVEIDPRVPEQILSIYSYIINNLVNEPAAYRLKSTIERKWSHISTFPNSGTPISSFANDISVQFTDIQRTMADRYLLLYIYDETTDTATISHIFHQTQDYAKIFQN